MKRRIMAMLMAAVMALSLAACGGSKDAGSSNTNDTPKEDNTATTPANAIPIKIANYYADSHPMNQVLNDVFKPMVEEGTNGRYTVEIYSNNIGHNVRRILVCHCAYIPLQWCEQLFADGNSVFHPLW